MTKSFPFFIPKNRESVKGHESHMKQMGEGNGLGTWKGHGFEHSFVIKTKYYL
jgi:hypothetical protein